MFEHNPFHYSGAPPDQDWGGFGIECDWLATIRSPSVTGNVFAVEDAYCFSDGNHIRIRSAVTL